MSFCANCGAEAGGAFCSKCGASIAAPPPPAAHTPAATTELPENLVCALAYALWALTGILFLVLEPYNARPRVRFHAMQSLFFSGVAFVVWFGLLLVSTVLSLVPFMGAVLGSLALALFGLAMLGVWGLLMLKAYQGQDWKIPILGELAEKQSYSK